MNAQKLINLFDGVLNAIAEYDAAVEEYDTESENTRIAVEKAAGKFLDDGKQRRSAITAQIKALEDQLAKLTADKEAILKQLAQAAADGRGAAVEGVRAQLAKNVADASVIEDMKKALETDVCKITGSVELFTTATKLNVNLSGVQQDRSFVYAELSKKASAALSILEKSKKHAADCSGWPLRSSTYERAAEAFEKSKAGKPVTESTTEDYSRLHPPV